MFYRLIHSRNLILMNQLEHLHPLYPEVSLANGDYLLE
jgi:hypothetical protein